MPWPVVLLMPVVSYLLGSVSFSFLIAKWLKGIDIRQHGSGNAGATNTLRVLGVGPGILVLGLDVLKGAAAVALAKWLVPQSLLLAVFCGLCAIVGHIWPIFLGFKGGKGVATTIGVMLTLAFVPTLLAIAVGVCAIALTRIVSVGSLLISGTLPVFLYAMERPPELFWASLVLFVFVVVRHRANIVRLLRGKENKIGLRR